MKQGKSVQMTALETEKIFVSWPNRGVGFRSKFDLIIPSSTSNKEELPSLPVRTLKGISTHDMARAKMLMMF